MITAQAQGSMMKICISDRGPGFPAGMEERAFEKFTRGNAESSTPGVGLGLAICRAIVEAHDGHINVENNLASTAGRGAMVCFTLPLEAQPQLPEEL